jgi:hypothetical protein
MRVLCLLAFGFFLFRHSDSLSGVSLVAPVAGLGELVVSSLTIKDKAGAVRAGLWVDEKDPGVPVYCQLFAKGKKLVEFDVRDEDLTSLGFFGRGGSSTSPAAEFDADGLVLRGSDDVIRASLSVDLGNPSPTSMDLTSISMGRNFMWTGRARPLI